MHLKEYVQAGKSSKEPRDTVQSGKLTAESLDYPKAVGRECLRVHGLGSGMSSSIHELGGLVKWHGVLTSRILFFFFSTSKILLLPTSLDGWRMKGEEVSRAQVMYLA